LLARCGECGCSRWIVARARPRPSYPFFFFSPLLNRLPHCSVETGYLFYLEPSHLCMYIRSYPHHFHSIRHFRFRVGCLSYTDYHFRPLLSRGWWIVIQRLLSDTLRKKLLIWPNIFSWQYFFKIQIYIYVLNICHLLKHIFFLIDKYLLNNHT